MYGMHLKTMEASEMLDVLHVLLEDDNTFSSEEQLVSKNKLRTVIYEDWYGQTYKYKIDTAKKGSRANDNPYGVAETAAGVPSTQSLDDVDDLAGLNPFNPREQQETKPLIPFTEFDPDDANPFGGVLDAPLG